MNERTNPQTTIKRAFAVILYSLAKASYGTIANLVSPSTVQKWLAKEAALLSEPEIPINTRELEFDEMWHFIGSKKTKDGFTKQFLAGKTVAWVIGGRDADTFRRLFDKVRAIASITLTIGKRLPRYFLRSVITSGNQGQQQLITAIHAIILDDSHAAPK